MVGILTKLLPWPGPGLSSAEQTDLLTLLQWPGPAAESFPPSGYISVTETPEVSQSTCDTHFCTGKSVDLRLSLLPSPCTRWVVPSSCTFLAWPIFVIVSWLVSNILISSSFFKLLHGVELELSILQQDVVSGPWCGNLARPGTSLTP